MKKRKIVSLLMLVLMLFVFTACGDAGNNESSKETILNENFNLVYASPNDYKNRKVEFYGKIFVDVEKDKNATYLQVFTNKNGTDNNVLVNIEDPDLDVKEGDIIYVKGIVQGQEKGENSFGEALTFPLILATTIEVTDYETAFSPSLKTVEVNEEQNQFGYKLTLKKVEFAESETRAYIKIENASGENISFYSFNSALKQGPNQIKQEDNWDANYEEVSSSILPGIVQEGVVSFEPIDMDGENVSFVFQGASDDYMLDFKPYNFDIAIK